VAGSQPKGDSAERRRTGLSESLPEGTKSFSRWNTYDPHVPQVTASQLMLTPATRVSVFSHTSGVWTRMRSLFASTARRKPLREAEATVPTTARHMLRWNGNPNRGPQVVRLAAKARKQEPTVEK
jgi:hypothetical protein